MNDAWLWFIGVVVSFNTWATPMRGHLSGWLINYGGQGVLELNAEFHGYDASVYRERCMVAAMSPSNLGGIVWLRPHEHAPWFGPCGIVDVVSRVDWYHSVVEINDVAEVPRWLLARWGTDYGLRGEVFYGACPPVEGSEPGRHMPELRIDDERPVRAYSGWPYPPQQSVVDCTLGTLDMEPI